MLARADVDNQSAMRAHLIQMFQAGIAACHPRNVLPPHLPEVERPVVLAVGKAAGAMAKVAEARYPDARGVAIVPHGVAADLRRIALLHAGHPVPDEASLAAAERLLAEANTDDFVLVLLSGGASALACAPAAAGLTLAGKQAITQALLRSGAPIAEINCVRRHLSRIKGGRLRATLTLAISDTIGDCPHDIGSGPTVADPTTVADARAILERHGLDAPLRETPKRVGGEFRIVARAADLLAAAAREAARLGYRPVILGEVEGEAREIGASHAGIARESAPGTALISGGELTVTVTGEGRGGPNLEYALAASGHDGISGLAADSDGLDGTSGAAGAFFGADAEGAAAALAANDGASWFAARGALFVSGATGTNVNDLRIILVGAPA
ncbi:MAG: glycerate 2-kinase [Sphingomonadales bacterium]|nr:glycerate 2-kinase [Sphingomonadales bacterium]MEA3047260.1 glycerate 2-kinase [Sphingomonadales bacterium]